jgi:hypothetical protein
MPPTVHELFDTLDWGPAPESDRLRQATQVKNLWIRRGI